MEMTYTFFGLICRLYNLNKSTSQNLTEYIRNKEKRFSLTPKNIISNVNKMHFFFRISSSNHLSPYEETWRGLSRFLEPFRMKLRSIASRDLRLYNKYYKTPFGPRSDMICIFTSNAENITCAEHWQSNKYENRVHETK